MATKVKPSRLNVTGTPQVGQVPVYVDEDSFQWGSGGGNGDVTGPASSTDGDVVLFDGVTGKLIKDSGVGLSSKLDASALSDTNYGGAWNGDTTHTPTKNALYTKIHTMDVEIGNKAADNTVVKLTGNQTIAGTKTFSTSPVVPSKTTDATNTGTEIATEAQVYKKQDKLTAQTAYTSQGGASKVPQITTNSLGQVTGITEVNITYPSQVSDTAYGNGWDGDTTTAPSKNAVYDKISAMDTTISGKQDTLVSGTNIKTINSNSILGNGNLDIDGLPSQTGQSGKYLTTNGTTASWGTVSGGISNDTTGTTSTLTKIRAGTEAEFSNITPSGDVLYFCF